MLQGLLVAAVVINSLVLLVMVIAGILIAKRISRAADAAEDSINSVRDELPSTIQTANDTLRAAQSTLRSVDRLADRTTEELYRVDDILSSMDRLLRGATVADAAIKVVKGTHSTAAGVLAGIKEALRVFHSFAGKTKED
ncbi:MAG: hypothetical protein ABFD64_12400 [Armatimonadota bacterium]